MEDTKAEVLDFLEKCEQLRKSKFIMATTRIKDILKSIVNSAALYELFHAVTSNFDYISAKRKYLITTHEGLLDKSRLVLPDTVGERLAFIFCLLVEFDHNSMNFNDFLQQFFAEDGSYYSSFHSFCDKVIISLESLMRDIFSEELNNEEDRSSAVEYPEQPENIQTVQNEAVGMSDVSKEADPAEAEKFTAISLLIAREKNIISCSDMSEADKQDGITLLNELESAVREDRYRTVDAILRGYEYFSACHNNFSQLINLLSSAMEG